MSTPISDHDNTAPLADGSLNLEYLRKAARRLLKAVRAEEPDAIRRAVTVHPACPPEGAQLADALLVIARENGFSSWPKLRHYVSRQTFLRQQIAAGSVRQPDTAETVHLRCGSDIRQALQTAGFRGRFVEFSDPFCHGPVSAGADLPLLRRAYLQGAYGLDPADAAARVARSYSDLTAVLAGEGGPVVLWFEHDAYDQLILAYLLWCLSMAPPRRIMELVCVDAVPGVGQFVGLGQLSPESLLMLWEARRRPVLAQDIAAGAAVWQAYASGNVMELMRLAADGLAALPPMAGAVARHVQELPSVLSGLSLTQHLTLTVLADAGPEGMTAAGLFRRLLRQVEPLPWLGDMMYWRELADLLAADPSVMICPDGAAPWPERRLFLTPAGAEVLAGRRDYMAITAARRWFGPLVIGPGYDGPRWDPLARRVVPGRQG